MIKEVIRPEDGLESIFAELLAKKENLEAEKAKAKEEAIAKVDNDFAGRAEKIEQALKIVSFVEQVEIADEVVDSAEENQEEAEAIAEEGSESEE